MEDNCHRLCEGSSSRAFRRRCRSTPVPRRGPAPAQRLGRAGYGEKVHALALRAYDQIIGLDLGDVAVDGGMTKAPWGGPPAGAPPGDPRESAPETPGATRGAGGSAGGARRRAPPGRPPRCGPPPGAPRPPSRAGGSPNTPPAPSPPPPGPPPPPNPGGAGFAPKSARLGIPAPIQATKRWP